MTVEQQDRDNALEELQYTKGRYGPSYEACMKQAEYRSAAWTVVELNTLLIHWTLRPYSKNQDYNDLVGELTLTLFTCCYNWEPSLGKFSTYAVACMRPSILRHTAELHQLYLPLKLPTHLRTEGTRAARKRKLYEEASALQKSYTEAKDNEELSSWWDRAARLQKQLDGVERAERLSKTQAIYTHRLSDEDGIVYGEVSAVEMIVDEDSPSVEDAVMMKCGWGLKTALEQGLFDLNERQRRVIEMRFGLDSDDGTSHTLEAVGKHMGVTRERVRQIERSALKKIRLTMPKHLYREWS